MDCIATQREENFEMDLIPNLGKIQHITKIPVYTTQTILMVSPKKGEMVVNSILKNSPPMTLC